MDITGNKEINFTVTIIVGPSSSGTESGASYARAVSYIFKFTIPQITVESVAAIACNVKIQPAIVIEISHGNAHAPAAVREASRFGDVGEFAIWSLVVKGNHGIAAVQVAIHRRIVHHQDVQAAIVVA